MLTLQNFITPEPGICTEERLYYRETGAISLDLERGEYHVPSGHRLSFDTYFNLFNLESWLQSCSLDGLCIELQGTGEAELRVTQVLPGRSSEEVLMRKVKELKPDTPVVLDLSTIASSEARGVLYLSVTALAEPVTLYSARFATSTKPTIWPDLALSITTFRRELEVEVTVARLEAFLQDYEQRDRIKLQVIDNGQSANLTANDKLSVYPNRNLGGAGGFARGLLEARAAGVSHCLFMDDDASFHMENIVRTYAFLALAQDPRTALAGAMINTTHKWAIWENGAWFNGACRPLHNGIDLRRRSKLFRMQQEVNGPQPETFYGGWWFFAFPLQNLRHHPFPFFVRGDDVSFSIANDFDIRTLSGVVSFQDDFTEKESAQTLYLDLRNHLIHHLVFDNLSRSPLGTARVAIRFILRSLLRMHYSTAEAQLLAWRDVMAGPQFFDDNLDMSARRAVIKDLAADEAWQPHKPEAVVTRTPKVKRAWRKMRTALGLLTLNGHLVPFWSRLASRRTLSIAERGLVYFALGASEITFVNTDQDKAYRLRHSKWRFFKVVWEMAIIMFRFYRNFDAIKAGWREGYADMTTEVYWQRVLTEAPQDPSFN